MSIFLKSDRLDLVNAFAKFFKKVKFRYDKAASYCANSGKYKRLFSREKVSMKITLKVAKIFQNDNL